jgi:hypothetical protein
LITTCASLQVLTPGKLSSGKESRGKKRERASEKKRKRVQSLFSSSSPSIITVHRLKSEYTCLQHLLQQPKREEEIDFCRLPPFILPTPSTTFFSARRFFRDADFFDTANLFDGD